MLRYLRWSKRSAIQCDLECIASSSRTHSSGILGPWTSIREWTLNSTPAVVTKETSQVLADLYRCLAYLIKPHKLINFFVARREDSLCLLLLGSGPLVS